MKKANTAAIAGTTISLLALQIPTAHAEVDDALEVLEIGDKCFGEKVFTEEEVVATENVAQPAEREGDWQIGDIEGPEGWTFDRVEEGETTVTAHAPADTPTGEYTVQAFHYGYNKNQVTEFITFEVVEEDITESRTWTEREEVPCADDVDGDETTNGEDELTSEVLSDERFNNVDYKVLAQQQALNAPAPAPAAAADADAAAAAEVTPAPAAQQVQLADNGTSGALAAVAVGLLAVAGGALLMFRRRA